MKLRLKRFLSLVLTFVLLLSFFDGISFKYFLITAYADSDEDTVDAEVDAVSPYPAGDWSLAEKDGCKKNFFHNAVQHYLKFTYGYEKEKRVEYKVPVENPVTKKSTSYGSIDIYKVIDEDSFYIWEVKPCSYNNEERAELALKQLDNYKNPDLHVNEEEEFTIGGKDAPLEHTTKFTTFSPLGAKYQISFWGSKKHDGLILYKFQKLKDNDDDERPRDCVLLSVKNNNSNNNSNGAGKVVEFPQSKDDNNIAAIDDNNIAAIKVLVEDVIFVSKAGVMASQVIQKMKDKSSVSSSLNLVMISAALVFCAGFVDKIEVHAADGDYYELPATEENIAAYYNFLFVKDLLEVLDFDDEEYDPEAVDEDEIERILREKEEEYNEAKKQTPPRDPLIIHFSNEEKIVLSNLDNGVNFDLDNNGFAEKTAWIGTEEGILAIDLNDNGKIDNGGELFGDKFLMSDGKTSSNGFEALASLNDNDDSVINKDDEVFKKLRVWFDSNHNGLTDDNELKTVEELGIISIGFDADYDGTVYVDTNVLESESATVTFKDNTTKKISEFWFQVNTVNTTHEGVATVGNVPNFVKELEKDENSILNDLFVAFSYETNIGRKRYYLKHILYQLTDSENIDPNSRGGNIDARDLHVIEQFMGTDFEGVDGKNPNSVAAETLKNVYASIEDLYYNYVNFRTGFGDYRLVTYVKTNENGEKHIEYNRVTNLFDKDIKKGLDIDIDIYEYGKYLIYLDNKHGTNSFSEFKNKYSALSEHLAEVLNLIDTTRTFIGTKNNDIIEGTSYNDIIFGEDNDDRLNGANGNDLIYGGSGNDILAGNSGNDTYYFDFDHGNDTVIDSEGNNRLVFTPALSASDFETSISVKEGFVLINKYTDETISLPDLLRNPLKYDFIFDGKDNTIGGGEMREVVEGTDADDYLDAGNGFNIFYGGQGNDTIAGGDNIDFMYGGNGDDTLLGSNGTNIIYGEGGNDTIYDGDHSSYLNGGDDDDIIFGGGGDDILDGGAGNDILQGDHGNDKFIFGIGYDIDTLKDAAGEPNTIIIHGYSKSDMNNFRDESDLIIDFGNNTGDRMIIERFFDYAANSDITFIFDDGTLLSRFDIRAKSLPIYGNGSNYLSGTEDDDIIDAGAGDTLICGANGEDTYIFGKGYDHDSIHEWGSDHSFVEFKDVNSDEITFEKQNGDLNIYVNETEDEITILNFVYGASTFTFRFADGAEGYVDKNAYEFIFTKQPDPIEQENITDNDISEAEDVSDEETCAAA